MTALATVSTVVLDCAEPGPLAEFYRAVTGWEVTYRDDDCVRLGNGAGVQLGFQRVPGFHRAGWPDPAKQAHLDLTVDDLDRAVKELLALGATRPEFQPGGAEWVVLADPEGHLVCLLTAG